MFLEHTKPKGKKKELKADIYFLTFSAHWTGQHHSPRFRNVPQQQGRNAAMGQGVPMNAISAEVMQGVSEIIVEVGDIDAKTVGKGRTEEVRLDNFLM